MVVIVVVVILFVLVVGIVDIVVVVELGCNNSKSPDMDILTRTNAAYTDVVWTNVTGIHVLNVLCKGFYHKP